MILAPRRGPGPIGNLIALGAAFLAAACSNVVPTGVEDRMAREKAEKVAYETAVRELLVLETNKGDVVVRLFPDDAPKTVAQVRNWVQLGVYDGTWIHRAVREPRPFVLQAGDPDSATLTPPDDPKQTLAMATELGYGTTTPALAPESTDRKHTPGAVALAVSSDGERAGPQFVIALAELPHLDGTEPVFGQLEGGWSVVKQLDVGDRILRARLVPPERIAGAWIRDVPYGGQ